MSDRCNECRHRIPDDKIETESIYSHMADKVLEIIIKHCQNPDCGDITYE